MNHQSYKLTDVPSHVPQYVNEAFKIYYQEGLPAGVYKPPHEDVYIPVSFYKDEHQPFFNRPFDNRDDCHRWFQMHFAQTLRVLNQYYSLSDMYHEELSKGIRLFTEEIEKDIREGRETEF